MESLRRYLFTPVDAASLAVFRIGFGALLIFNSVNEIFLCLSCKYLQPDMLFKYHYFEWVKPWPSAAALNAHYVLMAVCAVTIMLGYYYRFSMVLFTILFSYTFLLDESLYLNHYYMVILFCLPMIFLPAHRLWSLDTRRNTQSAINTVPRWCIVVLVVQLEIILIHAGLAKLNFDWLQLEPLRMWMQDLRPKYPDFFTTITNDVGITLGAYGAIALHLLGAPLLFFKRWRLWVIAAYTCFHVINHIVFNIGIFPWFTLFASLLFLSPDWPRKVYGRFKGGLNSGKATNARRTTDILTPDNRTPDNRATQYAILITLAVWLTVQAAVPFRHWLYNGNVAWNEDGHRFSWRMKLRSKRGSAIFTVTADNREWKVDPANYLSTKQHRKMVCIPDMLWQFADFLEREWIEKGHSNIAVRVTAKCSLNGRPQQLLVEPDVNLIAVNRSPASPWIKPLTVPLP